MHYIWFNLPVRVRVARAQLLMGEKKENFKIPEKGLPGQL